MSEQTEMFEGKANINLNKKGLFVFTGNPIIDNGMAVLSVIAGKSKLEDVTPDDINRNIDKFFNSIKHQYNDLNASKKEKKHSKKKLKQHLISLYTTNHYLHGINNQINKAYTLKIIFFKTDNNQKIPNLINDFKKSESKDKIIFSRELNITHGNKTDIQSEYIKIISEQYGLTIDNFIVQIIDKKKTVETGEEYFKVFKNEIKDTLHIKSNTLTDNRRINKSNSCNFCGKKSIISLSKDIFPLSSALGDFNHGLVHICQYCYLASLFSFIGYINFKKDDKSSGMYFLYHFSHPDIMIEHCKKQIDHLQNEKLASLQTYIGGKYSTVFDDLFKRINILDGIKIYKPSVTIYFLLNDNRGAIYETLTLPFGLLNFWFILQSSNSSGEWAKMHSKLKNEYDYLNLTNGKINLRKYINKNNEPILKIDTIKYYLEEVSKMEKELINICEDLSNNLVKYYKKVHERKPTRRKNWLEEFYDFFHISGKKPYELFNNIFSYNNEYFRWTGGQNLISLSSAKILLKSSREFNLLYGLIEYFILNDLSDEELTQYNEYVKSKYN